MTTAAGQAANATTGPAIGGEPSRLDGLGIPAMLVAILCFSTGSTIVRKIGASGTTLACYRSLIAAIIWRLVMAVQGRRLTWALLRRVGPLGVLFGLNLACFVTGISKTSIASAEIIGAMTTVIVTPAAAVLYRERIPWKSLPFGLSALAGVLLVLLNAPAKGRFSWGGCAWIGVAITLWATYLLFAKRVRAEYPLPDVMTAMSLIGGLALVPIVAIRGDFGGIPAHGLPWFGLMTLTNGVLAHACIITAQRTVPTGTIATTQVAQPALAVLFAFLFLGEGLSHWQVAGIVLVVASLLAFLRSSTRQQREMAPEPAGHPSN